MLQINQIAHDASIPSERINEAEELMELYQKTNIAQNKYDIHSHDGYGMKFRSADQEFSDKVYLANDSKEYYQIASALMRARDEYDVPSNGVLPWMTSVYTNKVIQQVFQTLPIWEIATDFQQGTFGTTRIFIPIISYAANATQYSDAGTEGSSSVNVNYVERDTITLQQMIQYGDLANAQFSMGKISLVEQLRSGANKQIGLDINKIAFRGYAGREINGVLNDPSNLPTMAFPMTSAKPTSSNWMYATFNEILYDIQLLFAQVMGRGEGNIDYTTPCYLTVPPQIGSFLSTANEIGSLSIEAYFKTTFPNMKVLLCANNYNLGDPTMFVQLIIQNIDGQDVLLNTFSQLYNSHGAIRKESSYVEKISYTVSGSITAVGIGIATGTMTAS